MCSEKAHVHSGFMKPTVNKKQDKSSMDERVCGGRGGMQVEGGGGASGSDRVGLHGPLLCDLSPFDLSVGCRKEYGYWWIIDMYMRYRFLGYQDFLDVNRYQISISL